jgi:two-component system, OmpR family, sensor kinase
LATLALTFSALVYFMRRLQRPFDAHVAAIEAIAQGRLEPTPLPTHADEFRVLASRLNRMAEQLAAARSAQETARARLEDAVAQRTAQLTVSQARLVAIDAQRRRFFAQISHELRTPLTVLQGEAEIALRPAAADAAYYRDSLQRVRAAAVQLSLRVDDLMLAARGDADALPMHRSACTVAAVLALCIEQVHGRARRTGHQIEYSSAVHEDTRALWDADRIDQMLVTVLDNAICYSPSGSRIRVVARPVDGAGAVEIRVDDAGMGMAAHERERAFEPYFRGVQAQKARPEGAGLGLSIALAIARAHEGEISLEEGAERGLCVLIRLPVLCAPGNPLAADAAPRP